MRARPPFHLDRLMPEFKWEVTRRHPWYIQLWEAWLVKHSQGNDLEFLSSALYGLARAVLQISNEQLIDPASDFDQLDGFGSPELGRKALERPTLRQLVVMLGNALSADSLNVVSEILAKIAASKCAGKHEEVLKWYGILAKCTDATDLDCFPPYPLYRISPVAPRDTWQKDVAEIQADWRRELELETRRDRSKSYPDYLRVWDLREGWFNGEYVSSRTTRLSEIAETLNESMSTVRNWYRSAFQLIFGHSITKDLWDSSMGEYQVSKAVGGHSALSLERTLRAAQSNPQMVNESSLTGGSGDFIESVPAGEAFDSQTATQRIIELIEEGSSNEEIREDLGLGPSIIEAIDYLRTSRDLAG